MISIQQMLFNASPTMPQSLAPVTARPVPDALGHFHGDHAGKDQPASFATPALKA
jgi:hypothetical protein